MKYLLSLFFSVLFLLLASPAYASDFVVNNIVPNPPGCSVTSYDGPPHNITCNSISLPSSITHWMYNFDLDQTARDLLASGGCLRLRRASDNIAMDFRTLHQNGQNYGYSISYDGLSSGHLLQFGGYSNDVQLSGDPIYENFPYDTYYYGYEPLCDGYYTLTSNTFTFTPEKQITSLSPAKVWISKGLLNLGARFDLLAQVYKDNAIISSGQVNSVTAGSGGFNNATLQAIPFNSFSPTSLPDGSQMKLTVSIRTACTGSLTGNATGTLWYNDASANSQFGATIDSISSNYFLRDLFALTTTVGAGPQRSIAVNGGAKCSSFKPFGTWNITL